MSQLHRSPSRDGTQLATALYDVPGTKRSVALLPLLKSLPWATALLQDWEDDPETDERARAYLRKQNKESKYGDFHIQHRAQKRSKPRPALAGRRCWRDWRRQRGAAKRR
jgi:hypothetical protein